MDGQDGQDSPEASVGRGRFETCPYVHLSARGGRAAGLPPLCGGNVRRTKGARRRLACLPLLPSPCIPRYLCRSFWARAPFVPRKGQRGRSSFAISYESGHIFHPMIPLITNHFDELVEICRRHHVKRLEVFGSAAVGDFNPENSDIDFLVDYQLLPPSQHADAYFGLLEDLQSLFGRSVDLVEDKAIDNPYFRASVDETRQPVYGR